MQFKDYYHTLGVARDAEAGDLKKAFRKLARKYHPDVSKEADAELHMKEVNEAYAVLSDPQRRAAYDQLGRGYQPGQDFRPPPDWDAGFEASSQGFSPHEAANFSDFFAELFGRMGGTSAGARHSHAGSRAQGEDHHVKVLLDLEDAFRGATRQFSIHVPQMDARGRVQLTTRTVNVKIPRGVRAGQGAPGVDRAPAGDLLLEVQFKPHPRFRTDGRDLHLNLAVAPWEAALGAVVSVDLPHGSVKVRIPEGAQSGQQLRVRGHGIPSKPPGDLLLDLQVVLPPANTPKSRQFYENMARDLAFDPRHEWMA